MEEGTISKDDKEDMPAITDHTSPLNHTFRHIARKMLEPYTYHTTSTQQTLPLRPSNPHTHTPQLFSSHSINPPTAYHNKARL